MRRTFQVAIVLVGICLGMLLVVFASGVVYEGEEFLHLFDQEESRATVIFGGDMLFDRYIRRVAEQQGRGYVFSCISDVLTEADLVIANLEGPITPEPSVSAGTLPGEEGNYTFTHPPYTAELLWDVGIDIVNLANNHIWNFGRVGIEETVSFLEAAGVGYIGDPLSYTIEKQRVNDVPLAFIAFTEFGGQSFEEVVQEVVNVKEAGYSPIVYAHWGDEYSEVNNKQKKWARGFVEAGAVLVVGSHPHVVQKHEVWQGVPIHYSLGNFIFDQYFSDAVQEGLLIKATVTSRGVEDIEEIPVTLERDGRTCVESNI